MINLTHYYAAKMSEHRLWLQRVQGQFWQRDWILKNELTVLH